MLIRLKTIGAPQILWIGITISLIVALYVAYLEAVAATTLDFFLPRAKVTETLKQTSTGNQTTKTITEVIPELEQMHPPFIPRFVIIWGYIGAATYALKVITKKVADNKFDKEHIPEHIGRLFIGTALAVFIFFVLSTGGFFGLTIDVTKLTHPNLVQYVYAVIAFISGYAVNHVIIVMSGIVDVVFKAKAQQDEERKAEKAATKQAEQDKINTAGQTK